MSHKAKACKAVVFPELLGPIKTVAPPSSSSTECRRLKLEILKWVIKVDIPNIQSMTQSIFHRLRNASLAQRGRHHFGKRIHKMAQIGAAFEGDARHVIAKQMAHGA
jgi:hypothetical protein